jgi:hypothetical protein
MFQLVSSIAAELVAPFSTARGTAMLLLSGAGLAFVVAGTFARTMVPLRAFTVASQVAFLASALFAPNGLAILAYAVLIPINAYRLSQISGLMRRVRASSTPSNLSGLWLKPYMRRKMFQAGEIVFRKGDRADSLYFLVQGQLEWQEAGVLQQVGEMFGEIAFFSPDQTRTLTAVCVTECEVLTIDGTTFKQLFYQSPEFAFHVSHLIAARLSADVRRLQLKLGEVAGAPA